jgi:mRNA interferase RelE/StbE
MPGYNLTFKTGVEKDLKKIPRGFIPSLLEKAESLAKDPIPRDCVKISGAENFYRVRSGEYRIIYQVLQEEREVVIHYIRHRRVIYRHF